ncbi:MAG TPA: response regulator [Polyangia bacterium]
MSVVLVVDDEPDLLVALGDALSDEGWQVLVAGSAAIALGVARANTVDGVLCDLLLHGEDGRELKSEFAGDGDLARLPFVFMTASIREGSRLTEPVIEKPFTVAALVAILEREVSGGGRFGLGEPAHGAG